MMGPPYEVSKSEQAEQRESGVRFSKALCISGQTKTPLRGCSQSLFGSARGHHLGDHPQGENLIRTPIQWMPREAWSRPTGKTTYIDLNIYLGTALQCRSDLLYGAWLVEQLQEELLEQLVEPGFKQQPFQTTCIYYVFFIAPTLITIPPGNQLNGKLYTKYYTLTLPTYSKIPIHPILIILNL